MLLKINQLINRCIVLNHITDVSNRFVLTKLQFMVNANYKAAQTRFYPQTKTKSCFCLHDLDVCGAAVWLSAQLLAHSQVLRYLNYSTTTVR